MTHSELTAMNKYAEKRRYETKQLYLTHLIAGYALQGLSLRQIARRLGTEHGFSISHVTVHKLLQAAKDDWRQSLRQ